MMKAEGMTKLKMPPCFLLFSFFEIRASLFMVVTNFPNRP